MTGGPTETLLLRGPYRSCTGYGQHTRALAVELLRRGVALELEDIPVFSRELLPEGALDPQLAALPGHHRARHSLHVSLPTLLPPVPGCRSFLYTMFEGTRLPPSWVEASARHDELIVPTPSSAAAWLAAGFPERRIHLCPLGVDLATFRPGVEPLPLATPGGRAVADHRVRFLCMAAAIPRKNLPGLLRVWLRATRADDDAALVIKLSGMGPAEMQSFMRAAAAVEAEVGRRGAQAAPLVFLYGQLDDGDVARLFAAATHYISLSFGEGWDLPMVQAGAMGLRLLAPAHSAYLAYLDERCARLLPARPVRAAGSGGAAERAMHALAPWSEALFRDSEWWAPDEEAAAAAVREAIDGDPAAWPADRERFAHLGWPRSVDRLLEIVDAGFA